MLKKFILFVMVVLISSCAAFKPEKVDARKVPTKAEDRARKNIEEGRGATLGSLLGRAGGTTYEFSTSNPLWRASLEILDFLPLTTVDYSGGMIITDWYTENNASEAIKITVRFLANEIRSDSVKIIVHKKKCVSDINCKINLLNNSTIGSELRTTIIRKAAEIEIASKDKKKNKKK
jgi:hypothetical protein